MRPIACAMSSVVMFVVGVWIDRMEHLIPDWVLGAIIVVLIPLIIALLMYEYDKSNRPVTAGDLDASVGDLGNRQEEMRQDIKKILSMSGPSLHGSRWQLSIEHIRARDNERRIENET